MRETLACNLCDQPGLFAHALEAATIRCNVRRFRDRAFTIWRCAHCGSLHRKEAVPLDDFYTGYPMLKQRQDFATRRAFHNRLKMMQRHGLRPGQTVLDYGAGQGLFVEFLRSKGFDAVGYDPYVPSIADPHVLERRFDVVTSQDVLEHVDDPAGVLHEHAQLLKPGGRLFVGTPNAKEIALNDSYSMELHPPYHQHILTEDVLIGLCRNTGLKLRAMHHRFHFDTLLPMMNMQFIKRYVRRIDDCLDSGFEKPQVAMVLRSPSLLFFGLLGYFFRSPGNMLGVFEKPALEEAS